MTRALDFAVIGAQKAGTTSVFQHLRAHPELFLPEGKEVPFFSRDEVYARGLDAYLEEHFAGAPGAARWGTATPQYMADSRVPGRMRQLVPDIRLIALLRNPVERAFSHHQMRIRHGWESRPFQRVVDEQLDEAALARARSLGDAFEVEGDCYVSWGEYGRILGDYLREFPRQQVLVLYTEEMAEDTAGALRRIFSFLDVDPDFVPAQVGKRHHAAGVEAFLGRVPGLGRLTPLWALWRALPARVQAPIRRGLEGLYRPRLDPGTRSRLIEFYGGDVGRLRELTGTSPPWSEFGDGGGSPATR